VIRPTGNTRAEQEEERLSHRQVEALVPYGRELRLTAGDSLFDERSVVDSFYVVLEGEVSIFRLDGAEETHIVTHRAGEFTGGLAVLTGRTSVHRARALTVSHVLEIDSKTFRRVAVELPDVADVFISRLAQRMRFTQRAYRQQEKLAALGKLSAGLAHELNNPAAAARRAAEGLRDAGLKAQLLALEHDERFSPGGRKALTALQRETAGVTVHLDPLAMSDAEDTLGGWLEDRGVEDAWDLAPALAAAGVNKERLEQLAGELGARSLAGGLGWLVATLEIVGLANEVRVSAGRISELVGAMKEYTYMDRGTPLEVDVVSGLENTLTILGHKLKRVSVGREYAEELPKVPGHGGELNQVWTNLIDNAADAVDGRGRITIKAFEDGDRVAVEVSDDGPGIPREARARVFEPFFTTKEIGSGAGLGLDIVRRVVAGHGGDISVDSKPGETRFTVRLPKGDREIRD
jgi:signal transduction histidine kinase